jgi:hypothetical protein
MKVRKSAGKILATTGITVVLGLLLAAQQAMAVPVDQLPDLSALSQFTTFGNQYLDSNVTVDGNAGISANGHIGLNAPSTITGDLYLGKGATVKEDGVVKGSIFLDQDLTAAQAQVFSASLALKNMAADFTLGNVNAAQNFNGNGAVTVINMNSLTLGSGNITLTGGASDYFVVNIANGLSLTGSSSIIGNGVDASHILVNLYDSDPLGLIAHVDDVINGTVLIPNTSATLHGVFGAIFSGEGTITLMSGATVESVPFTPPSTVPDAGSTMLLMSIGLGCLASVKRKFVS